MLKLKQSKTHEVVTQNPKNPSVPTESTIESP